MLALELSGVSKRYGRRWALRGVDLSLATGSALGLLGPNGAGKTSVLRMPLGFTRASGGTVRLQGLSPRDPAARVGVAYLPERLTLPQRMTLLSFLRHHAVLAGLSGAELERDVEAVLEQTGLASRARDRLGSLSKGLTQRVGNCHGIRRRFDWPHADRSDGLPGTPLIGIRARPSRSGDGQLARIALCDRARIRRNGQR